MTTWITLIMLSVVLVVCYISFRSQKKAEKEQKGGLSAALQKYYRYQPDKQPVVKRNGQQQRIFDEYFVIKKHKVSKMGLAVAGVLMFIFGFLSLIGIFSGEEEVMPFCGVLMIVFLLVGSILVIAYSKTAKMVPGPIMTNEEYMRLVQEKILSLNIKERSLERLGLDAEQVSEVAPIVLNDIAQTDISLYVIDYNTQKIYSSTNHVTVIYFTNEQLFVYKIQFDMCCNVLEEWASEFFYEDICDISSHVKENVISVGKSKMEHKTVEFSIIATNSSIGFAMDGSNERISSLLAMKQKVRSKRMDA